MRTLVEKLPEGPLDIVGDVHGGLEALDNLISHLGYDGSGNHVDNRHLVFLGDLIDRGPDSVAVVRRVQGLVNSGYGQCILGNHEFNIILEQNGLGKKKFDNGWFYGNAFVNSETGEEVPQSLVKDQAVRDEFVAFFSTMPLVLERDDVRIVHACWQPEMVAMASEANSAVELYKQHCYNINLGMAVRSDLKDWQRDQRHQNLNPVKVLTSGLENKVDEPFEASGKIRHFERDPWWNDYKDKPFCFFGHYSQPYGVARGATRAICVDYGVACRWVPKSKDDISKYKWRLGAIRYPEMQVVFDNGDTEPIDGISPTSH